jgi:DNA-binding Lrp family transcriptional regulator
MLRRCAAKSNSFTARLAALPIEIANLASITVGIVSTSEPAALISVKIRVCARPLPASPDFAGLRINRRRSMTPFFVQIKCELGKSYQVANALAEAEIASEIYSTAGDYDLLVKFYVDAGTDIGHFVNEKVQCIPGIKDTHTIITFKAFQA